MHKTITFVTYGKARYDNIKASYKNAKSHIHMGCVIRFPRKYIGLKYYCKECQKVKQRVIKQLKEKGDF